MLGSKTVGYNLDQIFQARKNGLVSDFLLLNPMTDLKYQRHNIVELLFNRASMENKS